MFAIKRRLGTSRSAFRAYERAQNNMISAVMPKAFKTDLAAAAESCGVTPANDIIGVNNAFMFKNDERLLEDGIA